MGSFSLWHWLVVLVIVVLVFGTKRLKNVGQDLGEAVRGFKKGVHDDAPPAQLADETRDQTQAGSSTPPRETVTPRDSDDRSAR